MGVSQIILEGRGKVTGSQSSRVTRDHQEEPHGHLVETDRPGWTNKKYNKIYFTTGKGREGKGGQNE